MASWRSHISEGSLLRLYVKDCQALLCQGSILHKPPAGRHEWWPDGPKRVSRESRQTKAMSKITWDMPFIGRTSEMPTKITLLSIFTLPNSSYFSFLFLLLPSFWILPLFLFFPLSTKKKKKLRWGDRGGKREIQIFPLFSVLSKCSHRAFRLFALYMFLF